MPADFSFSDKNTQIGTVPEPIIAIPVLTKHGYQHFEFLVDSGADCTIVPLSFAEVLNLDILRARIIPFRGIEGSPVITYIEKITLKLTKKPINVICAFSSNEQTPFILGRKDIFTKFNIFFDNKKKLIRFIPLSLDLIRITK